MPFERFEMFGRSFAPKVTIRRNGHIAFSSGAVGKFGIDGFNLCELFYDRQLDQVGIRLTNKEQPGITVRIYKRPQNVFIGAKAFLDYCEIDYSVTKVYKGMYDDQQRMIVVDLGASLGARQRTRRKANE